MKLDHCLFGYDDGHRLLASSLPLGEDTSLLTELSDLAPGTIFGISKGYWTGLPVPSIGRYVLMYTWPAPEMSRPGCVWTHALLIKPSLLESLEDLFVLKSLLLRPNGLRNFDIYKEPLEVKLLNDSSSESMPLDERLVKRLISALYGIDNKTVEVISPDDIEYPLFAVWSQQWPRLRRNFRFQTAASQASRASHSTRFDVTVLLAKPNFEPFYSEESNSWISTTVSDIRKGAHGELRAFLWNYGQDVRRQRGSFRPLVEIDIMDKNPQHHIVQHLIELVADAFPELPNGLRLKQDLINGDLVSHAQVELISFIALNEGKKTVSFPFITESGFCNLEKLWPKKSDEILNLAEILVGSDQEIQNELFEKIIDFIQTDIFWTLTDGYPSIRYYIIKNRPNFLIYSYRQLDTESLIKLIPNVTVELGEISGFISGVINRENYELTSAIFAKIPEVISEQIVRSLNNNEISISSVWSKELFRRPELLLRPNTLSSISRLSLLYICSDSLGWLSISVKNAGITPWISAISDSVDDLTEVQRDTFNCFLVSLALISRDLRGARIVEGIYNDIHNKMLKSKLTLKGEEILSPQLPDLGWFMNWDLAYRFRLAVTKSYVYYKWPAVSYARLAKDNKGRRMLAEVVKDIEGGQEYFDALEWK